MLKKILILSSIFVFTMGTTFAGSCPGGPEIIQKVVEPNLRVGDILETGTAEWTLKWKLIAFTPGAEPITAVKLTSDKGGPSFCRYNVVDSQRIIVIKNTR